MRVCACVCAAVGAALPRAAARKAGAVRVTRPRVCCGRPRAGGAAPPLQQTVAQLSLHSQARSTLSLVMGRTQPRGGCAGATQGTAAPHPAVAATASPGSTGAWTCCGVLVPSCSTAGMASSSSSNSGSGGSVLRVGVAGSVTALDSFVVSGWHSREVPGPAAGACAPSSSAACGAGAARARGGARTGLRVSSVPDASGVVVGVAVAAMPASGPPGRQEPASRGGIGALHAAAGGGRSKDAVPQARAGGAGREGRALVAELCASVPVADGLLLTPGAVLVRQHGCTTVAAVLQSTWRF